MYPSERTPLAPSPRGPPYVFVANPHKEYRKQIKHFQCCVCSTVLGVSLAGLVMTILYAVGKDAIDVIPKPSIPTPSPSSSSSSPSSSPSTPTSTDPSLQTLMGLDFPLEDKVSPDWSDPLPDDEQLQSAVEKGKEATANKTEIEKNMPQMVKDSPTYRYRQSTKTSDEATKLAEYGHVMEVATKQFSPSSGKRTGRGPKVDLTVLDNPACSEENLDTCEVSRYRTINGSCNNLNQTWGVAMKPFRRVLPPDYADGVSVPRVGSDLSPLPSAREVSVTIHRPEYRDDPKFTVMLAVWGQFLDHDLTATALSQGQNGEPITCCSETPATAHPECMPVRITADDPKFKDSGTDCLDFVRSAPAPCCTLGPREQLNQASSFLDGSVVYGSDEKLAKKLRSFRGGKMRVSHGKDGKVLLPVSTDPNDGCNEEEENKKGRYCFMAGDARSNENLHLTTMHLLFVRQHNLIAEKLAAMHPDWDDEKIYQEARHIVIAQMQHITYKEFIPVILGPQLTEHLHLQPQAAGYWKGYNKTADPTIANNFAASSFRFAHTLLPLTQHLFEKDGENATQKEAKKHVCGLDLVSLNIQRGRDHGLPTYPAWREHCGFKRPKTFEDLQGAMDEESLKKMSSIYKSVDDVDLYTGSLSEVPIEGGLLGPTATCLLADQFKRLKDGDRYWYETSESPQKFSLGQLDEIRKTTLAGIICATSDGVEESQPLVMQSISPSNERVPCSQIPQTNLDAWRPWHWQKVPITLVGGKIHVKEGAYGEETAWDGLLPVALTLPANIGSELNSAVDVTFKASSIQWFSNLLIVDSDVIRVNGSFSAPYYESSFHDSRSKTHWINGNFDLKFRAVSSYDWSAVPGQLIFSPVYFKVTNEMKVPLSELEASAKQFVLQSSSGKFGVQNSPSVSKENFVLQSSSAFSRQKVILQQSPKEVRAPIFLDGIFNGDSTKFYWEGAGFVLLPSTRPRHTDDGSASTMNDQPKNDFESEEDDNQFDRDWVIVPKSNPQKRQISSGEVIDEDQSDLSGDSQFYNFANEKPSAWVNKGPRQRFLQAAPYEDSLDAGRSQDRHRVKITLVGGEIKTKGDGVDESMVWDGTLPVAVPLPANIGSEINNDYGEDVGLKVNTGIQWFSSSLKVDGDTIRVNGSFSAPDDENSYDDSESKAHWINGMFNLKFHAGSDLNWEGVPGQLISSPVYFKVIKEMKVPLPELEVSAKTFVLPVALKRSSRPENILAILKKKAMLQSGPTSSGEKFILQQSLKELKAPIFLEGIFSEDRTKFYWDGEGTVLLPSNRRDSQYNEYNSIADLEDAWKHVTVTGEHSSAIEKQSARVYKGPMQRFLQAAPYEDSLDAERSQNRHKVKITLVGGEIKTKDDGVDESMVWDGTLPVAVPLPANIGSEINNDYVEDDGLKVNAGIQWFSSSLKVDGDTIRVNGSFSAPDDENSSDDLENKAHWINGNFNLKFHAGSDLNWEGVPGQLISSPVYFKVCKVIKVPLPELEVSAKTFVLPMAYKKSSHPQNSPSILKKKLMLQSALASSREKFILQQSLREMKAPIFLEGIFSEDRTKFYWDGEGTVLLPSTKFSGAESRASGRMNDEPRTYDDSKEYDFGLSHDWNIEPKANQKRRDSVLDGRIDRGESDRPSDSGDSQYDEYNSIADLKDAWDHVSVTGKRSSANRKSMQRFQLQAGPNKDNCTFKFESIPGHHVNISEAESEWELVPGTVCDYRRKGSGHLGPKDPPANRNVIDDIIDARKEGKIPKNEPITFDAFSHHGGDFIEGILRLSERPKKSTMQRFQLQAGPNKSNCTFKFESIPGHHVKVSEADSEWELVPGTVCDYRRKGSGHLGPKDPPRNKNVIDDIIEARNEGKIHKKDPVQFGGFAHRTDDFVKILLKALPAKESDDSSDPETKNRVLIKVDPSISLFPSDWKYDKSSGSRMIPVDYFYKVSAANRTSKPVILWNANLVANLLEGNISIPEFVLDSSGSKRVLWQNSSFGLNFQPVAENVLQHFATGGMPHTSRIVLKDLKCSNVENVSNDFETLNWQLDTFQKVSLIQAGHPLPTSDVLLLGEFTEDKTDFEWSGSLMIIFANKEKEDDFAAALKGITSEWSAIPLKVTAVTFNVDSVNGKPAPKAWSSLTPNSFPLAVLANNHITDANSALLWTGHVEGDRLKGNYTLPIFQQSKMGPHVVKGSFEMRLRANLPQLSWSSLKPAYTIGGKPPGHPIGPKDPRIPRGMVVVPFIDSWPPPPSYYPKTFPIPFPLNISSSAADPAVKTKLQGTKDNIDGHIPQDSGKSPSLLYWSSGKVQSQVDLSELIAPTPAHPHLVQNTIPWPPSYPKWPKEKSPPPWEEPYPFADSNAEPHPDEPALAKSMDLEEKKAHVRTNSKGTQTDFSSADGKQRKTVGVKSEVEEKRNGMLHAAPTSAKHSDDVEKLTALYMKKLATVIRPGVQYATKLVPKSKHGVKYDTKKLNVPEDIANMLKNCVPSKLVIDGAWKENNDYYWPGNAVFLAPSLKPTLKKLGDPIGILPYYKGNYAARIVDGSLSSGFALTGPSTVWSGQMPAKIELPVSWASADVIVGSSSFVKGIHWTPTLVSYDRIEGTYYLDGEDATNSLSRYAGNFHFELLPLWSDTTINKLLIPGRKYYSKVVCEQLPAWMKYASAPQEVGDELVDVDEERAAPITIRGDFNADKTVFEWSGNAVIKIT